MGEAILARAGQKSVIESSSSGSGSQKMLKSAVITRNMNFTVPANVKTLSVRIFGGGGGITNNGWCCIGSGGGNMNFAHINVTPGEVIPVTIGAGGTNHQNGGTSSFGSYLSATGGSIGNITTGHGGNGGAGGGGGFYNNNFSANYSTHGHGGIGYYGGGGGGCGAIYLISEKVYKNAGAGGNGGMYGGGGGGGGGIRYSSTININGGAGGIGGLYGGNGGKGAGPSSYTVKNAGNSGTIVEDGGVIYFAEGGSFNQNGYNKNNAYQNEDSGSSYSFIGGGGGGGYGGCGGNSCMWGTYMSNSWWVSGEGGGGGGGYMANGQDSWSPSYKVGRSSPGGGGGGYMGVSPSHGSGGGYGNYYAFGITDRYTDRFNNYSWQAGNGICIIQYYVE